MSVFLDPDAFRVITGRRENHSFFPDENHRICLDMPMPEGWQKYRCAVIHMKALAQQQVTVRLWLYSDSREPDRLHFYYWALANYRIRVPFSLDDRALAADRAFLPPWPGVTKGFAGGKATRANEIVGLRILCDDPELTGMDFFGLELTEEWRPEMMDSPALVDTMGQKKNGDWPWKTRNLEELTAFLQGELAWARENSAYPQDWSRFGGWMKKKFQSTGWFHREYDGRRWWLVDPDGFAFFSNGMCYGHRTGIYAVCDPELENLYEWLPPQEGIFHQAWTTGDQIPQYVTRWGVEDAKKRRLVNFSRINMMRVFGKDWLDAWISINAARMRKWGINTLGVGVNDYGDDFTQEFLRKAKIPYVTTIRYFPMTKERIFRDFPDVFSPEYEKCCLETAQRELEPLRDDPYYIGYFISNEPEWFMNSKSNLAEKVLMHSGKLASKRALVHYLTEKYGDVEMLNQAWKQNFASFEDLMDPMDCREWNEAAQMDLSAFHWILVERYGNVFSDALRRVDDHHLNLGIRFAGGASREKAQCNLSCFDVFSFNRYGVEPATDARFMGQFMDMPMMIGEWHIGASDGGLEAGAYYAACQKERAQAITYYLEQSTQEEHLVGIHYFEYGDQPFLGRFDGENWQIGLVDVCNRPYQAVTEAFERFAQVMYPMLNGEIAPETSAVPLRRYWTKNVVSWPPEHH